MDKVSLVGVVFYGYHGVAEEERKLGQRFVVDVDLFGDFSKAAAEDNLSSGIDYSKVFSLVKKLVEGKPYQLLEAVALRICNVLLEEFAKVGQVTVRIKKPEVPLPGVLEGAMVELSRKRS